MKKAGRPALQKRPRQNTGCNMYNWCIQLDAPQSLALMITNSRENLWLLKIDGL